MKTLEDKWEIIGETDRFIIYKWKEVRGEDIFETTKYIPKSFIEHTRKEYQAKFENCLPERKQYHYTDDGFDTDVKYAEVVEREEGAFNNCLKQIRRNWNK